MASEAPQVAQWAWQTGTLLTVVMLVQAVASAWLLASATLARPAGRGLRGAVGGALLLHTVAVLALGWHAQRAWGAYWSWDPLECWALAAWIGVALVGAAIELAPQRQRLLRACAWVAGLAGLLVALGAPSLLRALAIGSRYLAA